ncbi:MAG: GSU2403 family nucleotidyltransferase fold protein [Coriobacteriia bacterium]|nr:GSU2403 family nucleotidyltransferase fold protein [Coriobacteriia bacterium]
MNRLDPVLVRGLAAIEPYLDVVVVAGGWVPHIYELLYDVTAAGRSPRTRDIDLAVPRSVPVRDRSIDELLKGADFRCEFHSLDSPPVTKYVATLSEDEIEIEFITDAPGSSEAAVMVQPDLTAQELHYVGLMLDGPWPVDLAGLTDGDVGWTILVPQPGAFVFHKSLVFRNRRDRLKAGKDLYYIFFVLDTFPEWRGAIDAQLERLAAQKPAWFKKSVKNLSAMFHGAESSGVDALLNQKPPTAFPGLGEEQFRQYAFSVMSDLIETMESAVDR